jgi:hypothetical protein
MKKDQRFYRDMQAYIAVTTIGPSTLRNQGAKRVIKKAQEFLGRLDLHPFHKSDEASFLGVLNRKAEELRQALPKGAKHWGAARKAMNLFLRDICYNRFLSQKYQLAAVEPWLELPLDSLVAGAMKRSASRGRLPHWPGLIGLTPEISREFQASAKECAAGEGISRVHLDMRLWMVMRG